MRVLIFGRNAAAVQTMVQEAGFELVEQNPELVITYGGDGTFMQAEYAFPQIPKVLLKDSAICKKCSSLPNEEVLRKVRGGQYSLEKLFKLEARIGQQLVQATNDIVVHNRDSRHALRYALWVNERQIGRSIIGDGVVIATPFGSTAYYRSITHSYFELGIGLAFNNSTEQSDHIVLKENSIIRIRVDRGPALIYADNQREEIVIDGDAEITIQKSTEEANIVIPA